MNKKVREDQQFEPQPTGLDALILLGSFVLFPVILLAVLWKIIRTTSMNYRKGYNYYQLTNCLIGGYLFIVMYYFLVPYREYEPSLRADKAIELALLVGVIALLIVAVLYVLRLKANKRFFKLAKEYETLVSSGHQSIEDIASEVHQPPSLVLKDLQYLLNHKSFSNGIIKDGRVQLNVYTQPLNNFPMEDAHSLVNAYTKEPQISAASLGPKSHECAGCGKSTILNPNESVSCEYCGLTMRYTS
ncbi:hypothetical protein SAMN04488688_1059 [Paenibacillus sp. cl141a]|uniref:hypothetical protein n=1 Tax=Paenibacillus sp. cl141a TaxID=1761877 RepID=UPI0008AEC680|nr:hypothetical protein [Paenibacillus sp. cl141a]SEL64354.1 hypothetical protein SAMN04488688_1059 [Paenibacillus sp. cl141a]